MTMYFDLKKYDNRHYRTAGGECYTAYKVERQIGLLCAVPAGSSAIAGIIGADLTKLIREPIMLKEQYSQVSLVALPPMRVARFHAVSRTPEDDVMKVLQQWSESLGIHELPRNVGFDVDVTPQQAEAGLRGYELWFVVGERVVGSGAVEVHDFPGGLYAAMTLNDPFADPFERIPSGWGVL